MNFRDYGTKLRSAGLIIFFGGQLLAIGIGTFTDVKVFNWVPYDEISTYEITVHLPPGPRPLTAAEVRKRYRRPAAGRENRSIHNLIALLRQYETTYGRHDSATVTLTFSTNGRPTRQWRWPADRLTAGH